MFNSLDASNFSSSPQLYEKQFEVILSKITTCYQRMKADIATLKNNENKIRDLLLLNYLKNNQVRREIGLLDWHFEREIQEDYSIGRTDIKILSLNTFLQQEAYYILECKRLNNTNPLGTSGLNAKYIENGIGRFTSKHYSSFHRVNAMIGFIVDNMQIHENVRNINSLLSSSFDSIITTKEITKDNFITDFKYHYHSLHVDKDDDGLKIYHLMFDFNENVQL